ncbi:MAG: SigE family RNA polymerase sigma factor [Nocardioides sp.]|uniref:SigE family RNA polymerase sigma factor n=1 Tax=Nocardioides sp. TaxID=35761 RepID=UPI0039E40BCC
MRAAQRAEFEEFARARSGELFRTAWLLAGDRHSADDLVQETLTRIYVRWGRVREAGNVAAYARTVLVRTFIDGRRRKSSGERPMAEPPEQAATDGVDVELRHSLVEALRSLAPLDRTVVVQRYLLDQDVASVAADLQLTNQAVRSRSSRALARLRDQLGEEFLTVPTLEEGQHR